MCGAGRCSIGPYHLKSFSRISSNPQTRPMPLEVGSRIAHYDVIALIGESGMGQVYQATDTKLNRQVALKR